MAEVVNIVNARPIAALLSNTDDPQPLSPVMLLTTKTRPAGPSSRPVHADRYLRTPSMETSPVPCGTILDQVKDRVLAELTAATKVDRDAPVLVCRRYRSCAGRITTL